MSYPRYRTILEKFQAKWSIFNSYNTGHAIPWGSNGFRTSNWKVNYAGLARYGTKMTSSRAHNHGHRNFRCFNCSKEGCRVKTCKEPLNLERIAENVTRFCAELKLTTNFTNAFYDLCQVLIIAGEEGSISITQSDSDSNSSSAHYESGSSSTPAGNVNHVQSDHYMAPDVTLIDAISTMTEDEELPFTKEEKRF